MFDDPRKPRAFESIIGNRTAGEPSGDDRPGRHAAGAERCLSRGRLRPPAPASSHLDPP